MVASESTQRSVAEINITPLVDVMLVLLVIFMVAAPVLTHRIPLDLPGAAPVTPAPPPATIDLRIDANGGLSWNGGAMSMAALPALLDAEAGRVPGASPLLRIDANAEADYGTVAKVLALARNAGMDRIGFVRGE